MKKVFSIIICGAVVAGFTSCKNEEEDIFGESSALRLNHAVATYDDLLTSAENGWVMEYFANEEEQGYPMLVKFDKSGAVTFAAKNHYSSNDVYATEESLYEVIADNGPVLSFNSYNTLFHIFADPADIPDTPIEESDETGVGHEGDYEFVIYEGDADHFVMKGKKHGLGINMYKLPADQSWDTYYDQIDEIKNSYFSAKIPTLWLTVGNERYTITDMSDGLFSFVPEGGDPVSQTVTTPYIVRLDGTVHLCNAFEGENEDLALQNFNLADDGTLQCVDEGQTANISFGTPVEFFNVSNWRLDTENSDAAVLDAYNALNAKMRGDGYGNLQYMQFHYNTIPEKLEVTVRTNRVNAITYFNYTESNGGASIAFTVDMAAMQASEEANVQNAVVLYETMPEFKAMMGMVATSFNIVTESPLRVDAINLEASGYKMVLNLQ